MSFVVCCPHCLVYCSACLPDFNESDFDEPDVEEPDLDELERTSAAGPQIRSVTRELKIQLLERELVLQILLSLVQVLS